MMPKSVKRFSDDVMLYLFDLEPGEIRLMGSKMAVRDLPRQKTRGWAGLGKERRCISREKRRAVKDGSPFRQCVVGSTPDDGYFDTSWPK
jgi:hypothetical protein